MECFKNDLPATFNYYNMAPLPPFWVLLPKNLATKLTHRAKIQQLEYLCGKIVFDILNAGKTVIDLRHQPSFLH